MMLHALGAHYTYAMVPYQVWIPSLAGGRNMFDRLVHFSYGLLLAYPIREMFLRIGNVRGFWGYFLPLDLTMSTSMLYELIEWGAAEYFGGDLGQAYLGTQGDVWDAHKDMALASLGALIAMFITALVNRHLQRDFAAEWAESIRVKRRKPLGEEAIVRSI
jgi:putative membrane protein